MKHVTVDAHCLETSGIGTYLQNVLPRIICDNRGIEFLVIADIAKSTKYIGNLSNLKFASFNSPMYSVSEQFKYR